MSRQSFFYAKVNVEALQKISSNGQVNMKPIEPPYDTYFSLPTPRRKFHVDLPISDPHKITDNVLYEMNLNPKHIICYGSVLSVGTLCQLEGQDGLWCLMTECSECFRQEEEKEHYKTIRCSTPNCANNMLFRQRLQDINSYVGK